MLPFANLTSSNSDEVKKLTNGCKYKGAKCLQTKLQGLLNFKGILQGVNCNCLKKSLSKGYFLSPN